jgi:monoamine oxidase
MLDTAIIGGGLCGVALARYLHGQGREFALFEARSRLGGRIYTVTDKRSGLAMDLGPTWFWPDRQPLMVQLVADLKLQDFLQHDEGIVLHLPDFDKPPEQIVGNQVHSGARRLEGGMASLIAAVVKDLPQERFHLGHVLTEVRDMGNHVVLMFRVGDHFSQIEAKRIVIAMPPRLVQEHIRFSPELDSATRTAMRDADTWMAAQAKVAFSYDKPYWREAGQSGNAFVTHEQAMVGEIYDACNIDGTKAALAGFVSLGPQLRKDFAVGLEVLCDSQIAMVFGQFGGAIVDSGHQYYQDWATDPFTCSSADLEPSMAEHVDFANPMLRRPLWDGRLYLGGSETASRGAGYLEGAIEAARRIERELSRIFAAEAASKATEAVAAGGDASVNAASLAQFNAWVSKQRDAAFDSYRLRLSRSLASQEKEQITQRAMLGSVEEVWGKALEMLNGLDFDTANVPVEKGRCGLTPEVQKPFRDFIQSLVDDVVAFNRTSCALSNFPAEHHVSKEYMQVIYRDIAAAWQEFSISANRLLMDKNRP